MEKWKDVEGFEGYYQVSDKGNIRSVERVVILKDKLGNDRPSVFKGKLLKKHEEVKNRANWTPRHYVFLCKNGKAKRFYVHRLVAQMFIDNPLSKKEVNHIDGNPFNNSVDNLEWVTSKENKKHAFDNKLIKTEKPVIKLDKYTLEEIEVFKSESEACRKIGVTQGKILRSMQRNGTCKGFRWKYK